MEWLIQLAVKRHCRAKETVVSKFFVCFAIMLPDRFGNFHKIQYGNVVIQRYLDSVLVKLF
jgi:hypothetical protein